MANMFEAATIIQGGRFLVVLITPRMIAQAKVRYRRKMQATKGSTYHRDLTPDLWLGDLGEMVIDQYLKFHKIEYKWQSDPLEGIYEPDFDVAGIITEIKCQSINHTPRPHYWVNVRRSSALNNTKAQHYVWLIFHQEEMTMYLAGYMGRGMFMRDSKLQRKGERITERNTVKEDRLVVMIKQTASVLKWMALNEYQTEWRKRDEKETKTKRLSRTKHLRAQRHGAEDRRHRGHRDLQDPGPYRLADG
jgi:hypothetical protein